MITKETPLKDFYNQAIIDYAPDLKLNLALGNYSFQVLTNHAPLLEKLKRYFKEFLGEATSNPDVLIVAIESPALKVKTEDLTVKNPDPGKKKIKEEYFTTEEGRVVRKRLTDMVFLFGKGFHLGMGPCEENDNQVINFVNNRLLELRLNKGAQLGHAAAVIHPESKKGMMFAGFSGAGKSTLSLEIMNRDVTFLSNDRVLISAENDQILMEGVPKHPRINPGTIVHNPKLLPLITEEDKKRYLDMGDNLWDLEEKYDGFIDQCYGENKFHLVNQAHFLILLNWKRTSDDLKIEKVDLNERRDLLPAFMKQTGLFYLPDSEGKEVKREEDDYLKFLKRIEVYELSGGVNFQKAADFCLDLLK